MGAGRAARWHWRVHARAYDGGLGLQLVILSAETKSLSSLSRIARACGMVNVRKAPCLVMTCPMLSSPIMFPRWHSALDVAAFARVQRGAPRGMVLLMEADAREARLCWRPGG